MGAQVGRRLGALFRAEHMVSSCSVLHSSQVVSVGAWTTEAARADKQASPVAWQGLKHLRSCHSLLFPSVHFCSFSSPLPCPPSSLYFTKAKCTLVLAPHRASPSAELSPLHAADPVCQPQPIPTCPHHISQKRPLPLAMPRERAAAHTG